MPEAPTHVKPRTRLTPEARREQVIAVAMAIFDREPYDTITLEQIARAAGVTSPLVLHYFGSKRGLFFEIVQRTSEEFRQAVTLPPNLRPDIPWTSRLRAGLTSYLAHVADHPNAYAFAIGARGAPDERTARLINDAREYAYQQILDGLELPTAVDATTELALHGWIGCVEATVTHWLDNPTLDKTTLTELLVKQFPDL